MRIVATIVDKGQQNYWLEIPFLGTIKVPLYSFKHEKKIGDMVAIDVDVET